MRVKIGEKKRLHMRAKIGENVTCNVTFSDFFKKSSEFYEFLTRVFCEFKIDHDT